MRAAFVCLLFLAGSVYSTPVESKFLPDWLEIPVYVPDWWPLELEKPDWWPEGLTHPEWIPWPPQKPEWWPESITHPEWIPWPPQKPEWWPESFPPHPEWITWPPQKPEWWPDSIAHPEWIPWPPQKPEWWPDSITHPEWIPWPPQKPEWWPDSITHPEWIPWPPQKPEWWPEIDWEQKPEINKAVRGTPAAIEEFPGIVQIEIGSGPFWAQGCAGSVLTSLHVLTSARCFSGRDFDVRFRRIRAGSSNRYSDGDVIEVENALTHPSFGDTSDDFFDGDIAVVRLRSFFSFGTNIQQTSIVASNFNLPGGTPVVVAGWGTTAQGNKIADRDLYKIDLVSIDNTACSNTWSTLIPYDTIKVTSNMICVGQSDTGGRDADLRDIGAPVYFNNVLVGVGSWGYYGFGNQRFPAVATAVSPYTNWIVENAV